jgi:antitoxin (DNA-binding transcriptional repressor) of toxin-antitoxin stability system
VAVIIPLPEAGATQGNAAGDHPRLGRGGAAGLAHDSCRIGKSSIAELLDATRGGVELALAEQEPVAQLMEAQRRLDPASAELLHRIDDGRAPGAGASR